MKKTVVALILAASVLSVGAYVSRPIWPMSNTVAVSRPIWPGTTSVRA